MKSRLLMTVIILAFTSCLACSTEDIVEEGVPKGTISYEEIEPTWGLTEEEKKEIFDEYMRNMFAKDIMSASGVLGCKINVDIDNPMSDEKSVTVSYFYDPSVLEDVVSFEDSVKEFIKTNYPEAEVVYTRGTPVSPDEDEFMESLDTIQTLPADLNANWNYVPLVPGK